MARDFDATDWHTACNGRTNPWFVTRTLPINGDPRVQRNSYTQEYAWNANGVMRRFKTKEAAQKVADQMQAKADLDDAREHARLATHHLIRATDGVKPNDPKLAILAKLSDLYLELTGVA